MLTVHKGTSGHEQFVPDSSSSVLPTGVVWVDIYEGTPDEIAFVERATRLHVPTLAELSEIENSSRLRMENGAVYLSTPIVGHALSGMAEAQSIGFVVTKEILMTVRFGQLTSLTSFAQDFGKTGGTQASSSGAFAGLMDAIIDRAADVLENIGGDLDHISQRVFSLNPDASLVRQRPAIASADLRETLRKIGRCGDLASKIRNSLLGLGRITAYAASAGVDYLSTERPRFETQRQDIVSLSDYDEHLANKVQLLLDATMGLISIEQNNIIKVLTVVSVVGVPPTLVASMYGMNFHNMPELSWTWGYPYGLALILLSAVLPMIWFKLRGWL